MEYIVGLSIFAIVMSFAAMSGASEAMSKSGAGYSYREFSAFLNWYQKTFSNKAYMARMRKDAAWLEHDMNVGNHLLFPDDCVFCKVKVGLAGAAAQRQVNAFTGNSFETHGEYRYDALNDLYVNTWNNTRLTRQTYHQLKEEGRLGEVERKNFVVGAPKALETLNEFTEVVCNIDSCKQSGIHAHRLDKVGKVTV